MITKMMGSQMTHQSLCGIAMTCGDVVHINKSLKRFLPLNRTVLIISNLYFEINLFIAYYCEICQHLVIKILVLFKYRIVFWVLVLFLYF